MAALSAMALAVARRRARSSAPAWRARRRGRDGLEPHLQHRPAGQHQGDRASLAALAAAAALARELVRARDAVADRGPAGDRAGLDPQRLQRGGAAVRRRAARDARARRAARPRARGAAPPLARGGAAAAAAAGRVGRAGARLDHDVLPRGLDGRRRRRAGGRRARSARAPAAAAAGRRDLARRHLPDADLPADGRRAAGRTSRCGSSPRSRCCRSPRSCAAAARRRCSWSCRRRCRGGRRARRRAVRRRQAHGDHEPACCCSPRRSASPRSPARVRPFGAVLAPRWRSRLGGAVVLSDAFALHDSRVAPRDRMVALQEASDRLAGRGPSCSTSPRSSRSTSPARRELNVELASRSRRFRCSCALADERLRPVLRPRPAAARRTSSASRTSSCAARRARAGRRRSYRRVFANHFYEAWTRGASPKVLSSPAAAGARRRDRDVPRAREVRSLARTGRRARGDVRLVAAPARRSVVAGHGPSVRSPGLAPDQARPGTPTTLVPRQGGRTDRGRAPGAYRMWLRGTFPRATSLRRRRAARDRARRRHPGAMVGRRRAGA